MHVWLPACAAGLLGGVWLGWQLGRRETSPTTRPSTLFLHLCPLLQVQKQAATPYVVLSGTIKPGQSRDAASGARHRAPPVLACWLRLAPPAPCPACLPAQFACICIFLPSSRLPLVTPWPPPLPNPPLCAGYATVDRAESLTAPTPILGKLGGGTTPLVGNAKVGGCRAGRRRGGPGAGGCTPIGALASAGGGARHHNLDPACCFLHVNFLSLSHLHTHPSPAPRWRPCWASNAAAPSLWRRPRQKHRGASSGAARGRGRLRASGSSPACPSSAMCSMLVLLLASPFQQIGALKHGGQCFAARSSVHTHWSRVRCRQVPRPQL